MTKQLKLSALVAALLVSASAFAAKPGYAVDQSTDAVARNSYNECWHTNYFDKATEGLVECGDKAPAAAVAAAPAAAPAVTHEKVTLSAKVLFAFDKAVLRPEAKDVLDPLVNRLKGDANLKGVAVNGYTDFLGSEKYNLTLSQKRADAVKDYFVAGGVPTDKVVAVGQGPANASMTEECSTKFKYKKGHRASAALKECLEADRRVELVIDTVQTVGK
ncbi:MULTISPECIES: OmpA family protein [unclassified Paludibacterium]|uniref:OmpA family protein n=1 Tax=unclassified Paludibacterium TaxID=2618429 RepID=UPI001C057A7E|nr:OmpA family protein [Paludibacterium sp. B53371]BEV72011.1 peptidoglycan-binding outer membrane protein RmpM [Paludibacterium sp. THUN1379]